MNKWQWFVFGIGFMALSYLLFTLKGGICPINKILTACYVRRYAFAIPAVITNFLGWICIICAFLESKKK